MTTKAGSQSIVGTSPTVTVIIPAYNAAQYIGAAVESVINQTVSDYEIIVVNDGSPDTEEMERALLPYGDRIIYIRQENRGPGGARNAAIRAARGEFVAFLDSDDYWEPDYLAEQLAFIEKHPQVDLVYSDAMHVGDLPLRGKTFMRMYPSRGEVNFESLLGGRCTVILSGTVARRRKVEEAGLFDENFRCSEDFDLWLRMARGGARFAYQRKALLSKRTHGANLSANSIKLFESALRVLDKTSRTYDLTPGEQAACQASARTVTAALKFERGKAQFCRREFAAAARDIQEANQYYRSWKIRAVLLLLRLAPRLLLSLYLSRLGTQPGQARRRAGQEGEDVSFTLGAVWLFLAKTLAFALSFVLPLLLVRRLSQHEFGLYKQVFLVVGTAMNILPLGFYMSAYYFLPRERQRQGPIVLNILLFNALVGGMAFLALVIRPTLLATLFNSEELVAHAFQIGILIFLWVVASVIEGIMIANQELRLATVFIVAANFSRAVMLLLAAVLAGTIEALIFMAVVHGVLQVVALIWYLRSRFVGFWRSFDFPLMRQQMSYALPLGIGGLLYSLQLDLHHYFVANLFGTSAYAIYAVGCLNLPLVGILTESVAGVMIPRASYLQKQNRRDDLLRLSARVTRHLAFVFLPLYGLLMVVGYEFITVLFTAQYAESWPIFAINLTLLPLYIFMTDPIIRAYHEHRFFVLKVVALLLPLLLLALHFRARQAGLVGTIAMVVGISIFGRLIVLAKVARILQVKRRDLYLLKDVGKITVAALVAAAATLLLRWSILGLDSLFILLACSTAFAAAYLGLIWGLKILTPDEKESIYQRWARLRRLFSGQDKALLAEAAPNMTVRGAPADGS